jgi:hypothetical protein
MEPKEWKSDLISQDNFINDIFQYVEAKEQLFPFNFELGLRNYTTLTKDAPVLCPH